MLFLILGEKSSGVSGPNKETTRMALIIREKCIGPESLDTKTSAWFKTSTPSNYDFDQQGYAHVLVKTQSKTAEKI